MRANVTEEFGASYGRGIGTNIFIGAIIGIFFGAGVGSLFGLILEATGYFIDTAFGYIVYGMIVFMVLGLNIGVLVGVITSYGLIGIVWGGIISGIIVGVFGMLAIFGPDLTILYGALGGIVAGSLIGVLAKYSIRASIGKIDILGLDRFFANRKARRASRSSSSDDCFSGDCSGSGSADCSGCDSGGCEAMGIVLLVVAIAIPVVIFISLFTWLTTKASVKLGKNVRKGSFTAVAASMAIFTIIGSNIALTTSFHTIEYYYTITIGAGLGLIFGLILLIALRLSVRGSKLIISPQKITWKDRYTSGSVLLSSISSFSFTHGSKAPESITKRLDDYFEFTTTSKESSKVMLNCWDIPEEQSPFVYIQSILLDYLELSEEEKTYPPISQTTIKTKETPGSYYYVPSINVTEEDIRVVNELIGGNKRLAIAWVCTVTKIPEYLVCEIAIDYLGKTIKDGFIINE